MSNPTIEKNGVTFTFGDDECVSLKITKLGKLDENSMPASDSNYAFVMDFNGVIKSLTLKGNLIANATTRTSTGAVKMIEEQMDWLLTLVDGAQDGYTFNSTYQTNKTVYCRKVDFEEVEGAINKVPFTVELVEGL